MTVLPTGSTTARTLADRAADVIDVRDYGAKCDGATDDSAAFNAAIDAVRARAAGAGPHAQLSWVGCIAVIKSTLNFTGLRSTSGVTIDGAGGQLLGWTNGTPVIDAMHSEFLKWHDISIYGQPTAAPNIGIQIGRTGNNDAADGQNIDGMMLSGNYTFAAFYNFGSEILHASKLRINNAQTGTWNTCFAMVQDGTNHWNVQSAFVAEAVVPDTFLSFDLDVFVNFDVETSGGCTPLWSGAADGHKYLAGYFANYASLNPASGSGYIAVLWNQAPYANTMLHFDTTHFEANPTDIFYVTGNNPTPVMSDLSYDESLLQATNSIFKLDPAVTAVTLQNLTLRLTGFTNAGTKVFDDPTKWTVSGSAVLSAAGHWNEPASFNGYLDNAGATSVLAGAIYSGTVGTAAALSAPGFSTGTDPTNGGINLGIGSVTGTPYLDYYGLSGMRLIGDAAHQISIVDRALGSSIASFQGRTAANGGNIATVNGAMQITGPMAAASVTETTSQTPSSSTAACTIGQHAWDTNYEYRCVATNQWRRLALSSF